MVIQVGFHVNMHSAYHLHPIICSTHPYTRSVSKTHNMKALCIVDQCAALPQPKDNPNISASYAPQIWNWNFGLQIFFLCEYEWWWSSMCEIILQSMNETRWDGDGVCKLRRRITKCNHDSLLHWTRWSTRRCISSQADLRYTKIQMGKWKCTNAKY